MTIFVLRIKVELNELLQEGQSNLLDFGPNVEIDKIEAGDLDDITLIDAFKTFISDVGVYAPKRGFLKIDGLYEGMLFTFFKTIVDVFCAASQPLKLFQVISAKCYGVQQLIDQILKEKILKLIPKDYHKSKRNSKLRTFHMDHPHLKLALDVKLGYRYLCFKLVYL